MRRSKVETILISAFLACGMILPAGCGKKGKKDKDMKNKGKSLLDIYENYETTRGTGETSGTTADPTATDDPSVTSDPADTDPSVTSDPAATSGKAPIDGSRAELRFDSFDGGGFEYTITIEDTGVASYDAYADYGDQNHEEIDGASYDYVVTVFAVAPGSTTMEVVGSSPIMEEERYYYQIDVGDDLQITVTEIDDPAATDD